jgi:hypothetical protein
VTSTPPPLLPLPLSLSASVSLPDLP